MKRKLSKSDALDVLNILWNTYPDADCALNYKTPFQLLVAVVLSAQTTDKAVNLVTPELFAAYPDAHSLSKISPEELQERLKRLGMYKTKAKNLLSLSKDLSEKFNGVVPNDYESLISLAGVGRKSANVVLSNAFGVQKIAVDTHVFRVSNRLGLVNEKDVLKTELSLMKVVPEDSWTKTHHTLIFHGRQICSAINPKCMKCPVKGICLFSSKNL